jgi:CRP-like cAMP-binding protein
MTGGSTGNRLLDAFPDEVRFKLIAEMRLIPMEQHQVLYEPGASIESVYFPLDGMISSVTQMEDGTGVETATTGIEGMVSVSASLSARPIAQAWTVCQIRGDTMLASADSLRRLTLSPGRTRDLLGAYAETLLAQAAQSIACNALHSIPQRLARRLLETHDRVGSDEFSLTQEFLAQMLGTRRASVSEAAGDLQEEGFIRYQRGHITLTDRKAMQRASCECYEAIVGAYNRIVPV